MGVASRYWQLVKIDAAGGRQVQEITPAKAFFADVFSAKADNNDVPDAEIQLQLLQLSRDAPADRCLLAQRCLLCFISWQIEQVCLQLETNFGTAHGFSCSDLLPYVLDDDGRLEPTGSYECLSRKILHSFDPDQSSLTTWTTTKVKQYPALNQFLLESGLYLVSDWAILNDTRPKQLERIFREFYSLTPREIEYFVIFLESYHLVYRAQRLQQRSLGIGGKCLPPTTQQLQEIALNIQSQSGQMLKNETVMTQLQKLASLLRQYRIHVRGGSLPTTSIDVVGRESILNLDVTNAGENEDEEAEFLQLYRPQFLACLDQALALVITLRVKQLQGKKGDKAKKFLIALQLVHCQQIPMTEIASRLGLRAQDAVTRLLKLKEFRADVQQQLLVILRDRVLDLAKNYFDPEHLQTLENQISSALDEQISTVLRDAKISSQTPKSSVVNNLFSQQLCRYLDTINE
ncbi:hypothetical protein H1Q63_13200 [Desmonostoc muscorum CCALA 125]|nr:hypothetical protein [Desmonostoc muscorum CCALA 125]